jgi:3-hydroxybutyryl-CoA dehydrogenase
MKRAIGSFHIFIFAGLFISLPAMTIAAIADNHVEIDLQSFFAGEDIDWILLTTVPAADEPVTADIVLDLDFVNESGRCEQLAKLQPALIMVNAVVPTLQEIGRPFVRINGWPGFRARNMHELVTPDEATTQRLHDLYARLGYTYRLVPDTAGMIAPRILAGVINEAWYAWEEQVSTKEEIDTAMKLGTNYPFGPFEWGERIGLDQIAGLLWSLSMTDPRYLPAGALQQAAQGLKCD